MMCHALRPSYAVGGKAITTEELSATQCEDPQIECMLIAQENHTNISKHYVYPLEIKDGSKTYDIFVNKAGKPYVPESLRFPVFKTFHELAHSGIRRTFVKIKQHFFWSTLKEQVKLFCRSCDRCQRGNVKRPETVSLASFPVRELKC